MDPNEHTSGWRLCVAAGVLVAGWLSGCASDVASEQEPVVGSNQIVERETTVSVLQSLRIRVPFKVTLRNGEPKKVVLRGEDNLLDLIGVEEESVNHWRIVAESDLKFVQHAEIDIEVPYIDMVEVRYNRDNVRFIDKPGTFLQEPAGTL